MPPPPPNDAPANPPDSERSDHAKRKTSLFRKFVYFVILLIALSLLLQFLGVGVMDRSEENELIEQPHLD